MDDRRGITELFQEQLDPNNTLGDDYEATATCTQLSDLSKGEGNTVSDRRHTSDTRELSKIVTDRWRGVLLMNLLFENY